MGKILITAFEPFGGKKDNTSALVLDKLPEVIAGYQTEKVLLPVVFGRAAEKALAYEADYIFLLGEAGGKTAVTPELRARNLREARIADNAGNMPSGEKILPEGPEESLCRFPVREIVEQMREEGYGISVSEDAGSFVCNDTFYLVNERSTVPVSFIHVPAEPEKAEEYAGTVGRFIGRCLLCMLKKLDHDSFRNFVNRHEWTFAKTYAAFCPHEYIVMKKLPREEWPLFAQSARLIREEGFTAEYGRLGPNRYYIVDEYYYWTLDKHTEDTVLINRAKLSDFEFVDMNGKKIVRRRKTEG